MRIISLLVIIFSSFNLCCQDIDDIFLPEVAIKSPFNRTFIDYRDFDTSELRRNNYKEIVAVEFRNRLTDAGEFIGPGKSDTIYHARFNDKMQILFQFKRNDETVSSYKYYYIENNLNKIIISKDNGDSTEYYFNSNGKIQNIVDHNVLTKYYYGKDGLLSKRSIIYKEDESRGQDSVICEFTYDYQSRLIKYNQYPSKTFELTRHQMHTSNISERIIYDYSIENVLKKNNIVFKQVTENYLIELDGFDEFHYYKFRKGFQEVIMKNAYSTFVAYLHEKSNLPYQIRDQYRFAEITFTYK